MSDWLGIAVTFVLGIVGLYLVHSLRQQIRAKVADKRFDAYAALWSNLKSASPFRALAGAGPLSTEERTTLFNLLTDWYYDDGKGMLLAHDTRNIYLQAKENLLCAPSDLKPASLAQRVLASADPEEARSAASIRQLSLLRTSMRGDIKLYASPYGEPLSENDEAFLRACTVNPNRAPWRSMRWRRRLR